jgi:hypothetical protein
LQNPPGAGFLFSAVRPHQLPFGKDTALHRPEQIIFRRAGFEVEHRVEGVEFEVVTFSGMGWPSEKAELEI